MINREKDETAKRLKTIQKEAGIGICNGENPAMLFHVLLSCINDEEMEEVKGRMTFCFWTARMQGFKGSGF